MNEKIKNGVLPNHDMTPLSEYGQKCKSAVEFHRQICEMMPMLTEKYDGLGPSRSNSWIQIDSGLRYSFDSDKEIKIVEKGGEYRQFPDGMSRWIMKENVKTIGEIENRNGEPGIYTVFGNRWNNKNLEELTKI